MERWCRELTDKRIRRESFDSVPDLTATIEDYIMKSNQNSHIFVCTASAEKSSRSSPNVKKRWTHYTSAALVVVAEILFTACVSKGIESATTSTP